MAFPDIRNDEQMNCEPTVYVVDADGPTRDGIRNLADTMNLRCEAYASGRRFLNAYDNGQFGCVVLEVRIPDVNGFEIQEWLRAQGSEIPVLFLSGQATVSMAVRAMRSGALHFLEKPFREHELWDAIQEAVALAKERRGRATCHRELDRCLAALTAKERKTLTELAEGRSKAAIASEAGVCVRTVEVRRRNLMKRLGFKSPIELMRFALVACDGHAPTIPKIPDFPQRARNGRPRAKAERAAPKRSRRSLRGSKAR